MDFLSRDSRPAPQAHHTGHPPAAGAPRSSRRMPQLGGRLVAGLVAVLILLAAIWLISGKLGSSESGQLDNDRYQAVFLTNNQVYFGKIVEMTDSFFVLKDVFYIETPQSQNQPSTEASNTNYTLRKLGTNELHAPEDQMVINREQVTFWENLKNDGQVVNKIKEYKANPDAANQQNTGSQQNQNTQDNTQPTENDTDNNTQP